MSGFIHNFGNGGAKNAPGLWCGFALCSILIPLPIHAQRYVKIVAEIKFTDFFSRDENGNIIRRDWAYSAVTVAGINEWRIDNNFARNAEPGYFFDGTNVYRSIHILAPMPIETSEMTPQPGIVKAPLESSKSHVSIEIDPSADGHPIGNGGVNLPWLAFCSGTYLKRPGRLVPLPITDLRHTPNGFGYRDKTETFVDELGLPRTLDLFISEELTMSSVINFNNKYLSGRDVEYLKQAKVKGPEGFLKFHYAVTESTNFLGWTLPLAFEYAVYKPGTDGGSILEYAGKGTVTSVAESSRPDGFLNPSLQQTFVDHRFHADAKGVTGIVYQSSQPEGQPARNLGGKIRAAD